MPCPTMPARSPCTRATASAGTSEEYVDNGAMTDHRTYGVIAIWAFTRSWISLPRGSVDH